MNIITAVIKDFVRFFNLKTKVGLIRTMVVTVVVIVGAQFLFGQIDIEPEPEDVIPTVLVGTANSVTNNSAFSLIGTVASQNQARIQTEAAGRVVQVNVELGDQLRAGTIIAELENASQYAAVLQAEGAYESALAAAAQSDVSTDDAANSLRSAHDNALNVYRNAFTTANSAILTNIDTFYSNPHSLNFGVRIDAHGQAVSLVEERKAIGQMLSEWQTKVQTATADGDVQTLLADAYSNTNRIIAHVDVFIDLTNTARVNDTHAGEPVRSYTEGLITLRSNLSATLNAIDSAGTAIQSAEEALRRAQIGGTSETELSAASAQIKQALGSLRAAQATYNKTIIRTPIAGTLNELDIKAGDYATVNAPVALVANNNALEVTTFVGEADTRRINVGDTLLIEGTNEGVVTAIAPGVDSDTRKTEVRIGTESAALKTGDIVTITFPTSKSETEIDENAPILIPISAVKFTATDGSIFIIVDGTLVSQDVVVGPVVGSFVTIEAGLDRTTLFVLDARGVTEGTEVEAITR